MRKTNLSKNCLECDKVFKVIPSVLRLGKVKYCSSHCRSKNLWKSKNYRDKQVSLHKGKSPANLKSLIDISRSEAGRERMRVAGKKLGGWNKNKSMPSISGKKHYNWKGGVSKIDKICRGMLESRQWRSDVFTRDNWTCQTCGITGVYVTAHHKNSFSNIIKNNLIKNTNDARKCKELWDVNNGITLCEECHSLTDNYKGRANSIIKK